MPLVFTNRFRRAYKRLPQDVQMKLQKSLRLLDENPRHPSLQVKQIQGTHGIYEGRVDHKYRFSFEFDGEELVLRNVDNHTNA